MKILFILFFIFFPSLSFSQVYKCVNAGKTSYEPSPCSVGGVAFNSSVSGGVDGSMTLQRASNNGFYVQGSINNLAVNFLVDTGASQVVIGGSVASQLGLQSCRLSGVSATAAGNTGFCEIMVESLQVGIFSFRNVGIHVVPSMGDTVLLGGELLKRFKIEQSAQTMTLTR